MNRAPATLGIRHRVKLALRRVLEDLHVSHDCVAASADVSRQRVERQLNAAEDAQPPLYLLAVLPDDAFERVVAEMRALRRPSGATSTEGVGMSVVAHAGDAVAEIGRALADLRITAVEVPAVRRKVAALRDLCDSFLRTLASRAEGVQ